jgi:hypothetical protein
MLALLAFFFGVTAVRLFHSEEGGTEVFGVEVSDVLNLISVLGKIVVFDSLLGSYSLIRVIS